MKTKIDAKTLISENRSTRGETIEMKIQRIMNNREPIKDGSPLIYTDRKEGVKAGYDIRTDRFEIAIEAMDKVTKSVYAKRAEGDKPKEEVKAAEPKTGPATDQPS